MLFVGRELLRKISKPALLREPAGATNEVTMGAGNAESSTSCGRPWGQVFQGHSFVSWMDIYGDAPREAATRLPQNNYIPTPEEFSCRVIRGTHHDQWWPCTQPFWAKISSSTRPAESRRAVALQVAALGEDFLPYSSGGKPMVVRADRMVSAAIKSRDTRNAKKAARAQRTYEGFMNLTLCASLFRLRMGKSEVQGHGLFAARAIAAQEVVPEFHGDLIGAGVHSTSGRRPPLPRCSAEGVPSSVPEPLVRSKRLPLHGDRRQGGRAIEARMGTFDERNPSWGRAVHHVPQAVHHQPRSGRHEVHLRRAGVSPEDISALLIGRFRG
ncbi:unnamed protein product, partial [Ectocarpus sp. 8 AP-2014]